jgi:phage FluMu gp28-like protein
MDVTNLIPIIENIGFPGLIFVIWYVYHKSQVKTFESLLNNNLHSIRRVVTTANNVRFDADRTEQGHADRFWALSLALHACQTQVYQPCHSYITRRRSKMHDLLEDFHQMPDLDLFFDDRELDGFF